MPNVVVYATALCPFCMRAKRLLDSKGIEYKEIRVDREEHLRREMEARSGRTSVPQIFIDDHHVGGFDDLSELDMEGTLDDMLQIA